MGDVEVHALREVSLTVEARRVRGGDGLVGLGQVDADEHRRLPRPPDARRLSPRRARGLARWTARELARHPQPDARLRVPELQPAGAHQRARERRAAAGLRRRRRARAAPARAARRSARVGLGERAATTTRTSCRAGSSSASPSRARWSREPRADPRRRADRQPGLAHQRRDHGAVPGAVGAPASRSCWSRTSPTSPRTPRAWSSCATATSCSDTRQTPRRAAVDLAATPPSRTSRRRRPHDPARDLPRRAARAAAQQDALVPDDARHHHRRRRRHRDGRHRRRGQGARSRQSFASMGTNLLIVMSGSTQSGGARGGFGSMPTLTWDDLRAIRNEVPSVRFAAAQLRSNAPAHERGPELDDPGQRHVARVLRDPQLDGRARARRCSTRTSTRRPRSSCSGRPSSTSCSAPSIRSARRCASRTSPSRWSACWRARGSRAMGQDYDDARVRPADHVPEQDPGRASEVPRRHDLPGRGVDRGDVARRDAGHRPAARPPPHAARRRRRLFDPQPDRDGQRAGRRARAR